jgi:hypothetical protein
MKINFSLSNKKQLLATCKKQLVLLSILRVVVFLALLAVALVGISELPSLLLLFFPLSAVFIILIKHHNMEKDKEQFLKTIVKMEEEEALRANRVLSSFDPGTEFLEKDHPFTADLDIFGSHSLYQLINHTVSKEGKNLLATWLKSKTDPEIAKRRHGAMTELSQHPEFLLKFEGLGRTFVSREKSKSALFNWLRSPNHWKQLFWVPAIFGPVGGSLLLVIIIMKILPAAYLGLFIIIGAGLLGSVFKPLMYSMKIMPNEWDLKTFKSWAHLLEEISFEHPYLQSLQEPISSTGFRASQALESLEQQTFLVQNRANLMYLVFNMLFWVDFWVLLRLETWKRTYGNQIQQWEFIFQEWEALISLAAHNVAEHPSTEIEWTQEAALRVKNIRHPLISPKTCIGNDFSLAMDQKIVLLTGSNMSGKTTFMRTLGINLVMANLGLNPPADSFSCGPFQLYTSMRNADNLGESVSSFYAELNRIKGLLSRINSDAPVFFLLDEILKGTNTADRITGSKALIAQLLNSTSKGIISTHDMELTKLEGELPGLENRSFHHEIKADEIHFDYKIKPGSCPNFNARKLMELMGIALPSIKTMPNQENS